MKSQFGDYFNHDSDAVSYDSDVLEESDLSWGIAAKKSISDK